MKNIILITIFSFATSIIFGQNQKLSAYSDNKPSATYKMGRISVAVWEKQKEGKYGPYTEKTLKL